MRAVGLSDVDNVDLVDDDVKDGDVGFSLVVDLGRGQ